MAGDITVLLEEMVDLHYDEIEDSIAAEVRDILDHFGERTSPQLWWPGEDED